MIKYYEIGKIKFRVDVFESEHFIDRMNAYEIQPVDKVDVNVKIELTGNLSYDSSYKVIGSTAYRGYGVKDGNYAIFDKLYSADKLSAALYINSACTEIVGYLVDIEHLGGANKGIRAYSMLGEAFKYVALANNGFVFHSSTIDYLGKGILFSADSGTGKSTHTQQWLKYYPYETRIINDDTPFIRIIKGKNYVFGTPWAGKSDLNLNVVVPLDTIVFLERGLECSIENLDFKTAFDKFVRQSFILPFTNLFMSYLNLAEKVLKSTKISLLRCNISKKAVDTVKNHLEANGEN